MIRRFTLLRKPSGTTSRCFLVLCSRAMRDGQISPYEVNCQALSPPQGDTLPSYFHREPRFLYYPQGFITSPLNSTHIAPDQVSNFTYNQRSDCCTSSFCSTVWLLTSSPDSPEPSVDWTVPWRNTNRDVSWVFLVYGHRTVTKELVMTWLEKNPNPPNPAPV